MVMKDKYVHRLRISGTKLRNLLKYFVLNLEANKIALLTRLNQKPVAGNGRVMLNTPGMIIQKN